jgi:hypothetical protein
MYSIVEANLDKQSNLFPQYTTGEPQFYLNSLLLHGDGSSGANNNTFQDSSTNALSITRNGTPTQGTFSPFSQTGWSYFCNFATPDYFTVASSGSPVTALGLGTGAFTIEFWVFPLVGSNTWNALFDINQYTAGILMRYQGGSDSLYILGTPYDWLPVSNLKLGQWSHIALSRNASGVFRMYVNGTSVVTGTNAGNLGSTGYMAINAAQHAGSQNLTAYYKDFRIVKGSTVYDPTVTTLTVPTSKLTAIAGTSFLSCQDNRFIDNSTNALTITTSGSPSVQPSSPFPPGVQYGISSVGGSMYFNGSADYLTGTYSTTNHDWYTSDYTLECWVYPLSLSSFGYLDNVTPKANLIGNNAYNSTSNYWTFGPYSDGTVGLTYYNGSSVGVFSAATVKANQWNHIAFTKNSSGITIFVNGVASSTTPVSGTPQSGSSLPLTIGAGNGKYINGYVSNLRIVKGTAVYSGSFTPPTAPVTAITNTQLLINGTNAGVYDSTAKNDIITAGTVQISTSQSKFGGSSIYFATTGDGITIPSTSYMSILGTGNFTIEFWMRYTTPGAVIADLIRSSTWAIVDYSNGNLYWQNAYASSSLLYYNHGLLQDGNWHHVAVVRSATSTLTMYIDGLAIGSGTDSNAYNTPSAVTIGISGSYGQFLGYMDEIRISKYARYTSNFTPSTSAFQSL